MCKIRNDNYHVDGVGLSLLDSILFDAIHKVCPFLNHVTITLLYSMVFGGNRVFGQLACKLVNLTIMPFR